MIVRKIGLILGLCLVAMGCLLACDSGPIKDEANTTKDSGTPTDNDTGDANASCKDACSQGDRQCTDTGFQKCEKQANGCYGWGEVNDCGTGSICDGGDCVKNCTNRCSAGTKQCTQDGFQVCEKQDSGCTDWSASTACAPGEICNGGDCIKNCTNRCSKDAKRCDGNGVQTCEMQSSGCTDWSKASACASGETCSGGRCASSCTDQCSSGTRMCSGNGVQTCEKQANGCTDWAKATTCPSGEICNGGNCVKHCTNQCADGTVQCSGTGVQTCEKQASGCFDWGNVTPCASGEICSGGKCAKQCTDQCKENDKRCDGVRVQTCAKQTSGCTEWTTTKTCTTGEACDKTSVACVKTCTNKCNENDTRCTANAQVESCDKQANGCTDWSAAKSCPTGETCQGNVCKKGCVNTCVPGQSSCQSGQQFSCTLVGQCWVWGNPTACPSGTTCHLNTCAKGSETISQSKELCGTHVYTGTFTVQGGAKITCKSGTLAIYAKRIVIDPSSSIDLSGSSSSYSGGSYRTCGVGTCYTNRGRSGGGGGGNGTAGIAAKGVEYKYRSSRYGSCSCRTCSGGPGGPVRNTVYDQFVTAGGAGGKGCSYVNTYGSTICKTTDVLAGGKGGGVIRLIAEEKVTLLGKLLANGANGLPGNAGSGGGAGGGVLLAAPDVEITGSISATGGAGGVSPRFSASCYTSNRDPSGGAGGKGRIKILHGDAYKNTGTTAGGIVSLSWLPPQQLNSTTHPRETSYFNDTFKEFKIAWQKPYTGAKGYWYALSQDPKLRLTPTNGTYTTATSLTIPASSFTSGGLWYFYILTVHSNAKASTIANRWSIRVNDKPHRLNSTSHPSQTTWYDNPQKKALTIAWVQPSGVTSSSFRGYWYKIDRKSNTAPGRAAEGWTYTTNKQELLTQDAAGKPLDKWVYYFHLAAEDVMGRLTKVAAHYRIQLGTEPAKMNFFGYIKDGAGKAITGATLALEPFGLTATTDTNGYFFLKDTYVGIYQLSVKKAGFKDIDVQVDVKSSIVPYSLTMTP